jgi:3-oxoacyl-[acyl-carrier-protein] synthase-3
VERAGLQLGDIDALIGVGSVPAQAIPCTAALLQREQGLGESGIPAFDVNATCLGFLAAFDLLAPALQMKRFRHVLLVAAERPSGSIDWTDSHTAGLFGDGAGAVVIGADPTSGAALLATHYQTFGSAAELCRVRAGGSLLPPHRDIEAFLDATRFEMRGPPLYRFAAEVMPAFLASLFERAGRSLTDIDVWVPHQASGKALRHMQEGLSLPAERFVSTLATHGNQVAASLPVALHRGFERGQIRPGMTVALVGTGAGFSVGGAVLRV